MPLFFRPGTGSRRGATSSALPRRCRPRGLLRGCGCRRLQERRQDSELIVSSSLSVVVVGGVGVDCDRGRLVAAVVDYGGGYCGGDGEVDHRTSVVAIQVEVSCV